MVHCPWPRGGATPDWWDTDPIEVEGRRVIEHGLPTWKVTCPYCEMVHRHGEVEEGVAPGYRWAHCHRHEPPYGYYVVPTGTLPPTPNPTTLYRLFGAGGELLYIGIAGNPGRRWEQHAGEKPWWGEVVGTTLEHFPTREAAMTAEAAAIVAEEPRYNIVHNRGRGEAPMRSTIETCDRCGPLQTWHWRSREHRGEWSGDLYLSFEVTGDPVTDDVYPFEDPREHVERWARWLAKHCPDELATDAVRISWFVGSHQAAIFEEAPGPTATGWGETFTDIYTTPLDDAGRAVQWHRLPIHIRWPLLYQGLGWVPFALQPTAPVRTLLARVGVH